MTSGIDAVRASFDARASTYDDSTMHRAVAAAVADFADLENVRDVLDIATGTGLVLRAFSSRAPQLRLTGVDISVGMLAVARRTLPGAAWIEADAAALPIPDSGTDLVTCVTALHIIPDVPGTIAEWDRVLRPTGRIITATFLQDGQDRASTPRLYRVEHSSFGSVPALERTVARFGFTIARTTVWSDDVDALLIAEWCRAA